MYVPPTKTDGGASDGVCQRCDIDVVGISSRGLNDVGRTSLDRGSARGPRGPIPRSSIQERNERETKGITISDRTTMITPINGHRHATQLNLLQTPRKDASGMTEIIHEGARVNLSHQPLARKHDTMPQIYWVMVQCVNSSAMTKQSPSHRHRALIDTTTALSP